MAFLFGELKRRKVFQVAAVYAVVAWLLIEIAATVEEPLSLPGWVDTFVIVILAVGFPIALILSWAYERMPAGIKVTTPVSTRKSHPLRFAINEHTVGRDSVVAELLQAYESVGAGGGRLLAVVGEAGIGKTTVVENFLGELLGIGSPPAVGWGQCSERLAGAEAYLPFLDALESLLESESGEPVAHLMNMVAPGWYNLIRPHVLGEPLNDAGVTSQEQLKRELSAFLRQLSQEQPLVLFFEDLHWGDASTIDLLSYVADRLNEIRVLLVLTYRVEEMRLNRHPFGRLKLDLEARSILREIELQFLGEKDVAQYLELEYPDHQFPMEFAALLYQRTEGSPLFMVDLLRYLQDQRVIASLEGTWTLQESVDVIQRDLPQSARAMIQRKIDRLDDEDRLLLDFAAVQGYEFHAAVVAEVLGAAAGEIEERLQVLENAHRLVRQLNEEELPDGTFTARYQFVHVLYQNTLYGSLTPTKRAASSRSVAEVLSKHYGDEHEEVASELAVLFESGRQFETAVQYYVTAAQRAAQLSAAPESVTLAMKGLEVLKSIPESRDREQTEFRLQSMLATGLTLAQGWAVAEVTEACTRALELAGGSEDARELHIPVLVLLFHYWARRDVPNLNKLIDEQRRLAERSDDPVIQVHKHFVDTQAPFWNGSFDEARPIFDKAMAAYEPGQDPTARFRYGQDPGIVCRSYASWNYSLAGYPDQGSRVGAKCQRQADEFSHPPTTCYALVHTTWVAIMLRRVAEVEEFATRTIDIAQEHAIPFYSAYASVQRGWARAHQKRWDEGHDELLSGLSDYEATGSVLITTCFLGLLADVYTLNRCVDKGLDTVRRALQMENESQEYIYHAELHRLKGELLELQGAEMVDVEHCYRHAYEIARERGAKWFELRAATSLAGLLNEEGRQAEARDLLEDVCGWFTEGFETGDLQKAQALLNLVNQ